MQDVTRIAGKHDHVLFIDDLFEQDIHCRLGMAQQVAILLHLVGKQALFEPVEPAVPGVVQPVVEAPLPRHFDHRRQRTLWHRASIERECASLLRGCAQGFIDALG
jgi:hypothetical protein